MARLGFAGSKSIRRKRQNKKRRARSSDQGIQATRDRMTAMQLRLQELRTARAPKAEVESVEKNCRKPRVSRGNTAVLDPIYRVIGIGVDYLEVELLAKPR